MLDYKRGYAENFPPVEQETFVEFKCVPYTDVPMGRVFVPCDEDRQYAFEEPSCFMLKMEYGNWYLTGDYEAPLSIDRENTWDMVLMVVS
jgi:hypothetical protein